MIQYLYKYVKPIIGRESMKKIPKKFVNLGLRRDRNLSDVESSTISLNNLLNNLVNDPDPTKIFISEDLDAIRGLQFTNITPTKLTDLANIRVEYSEQVDDTVRDFLVTPLVTLKDRIDNSKVITGDIPAIRGGLGLKARFIPSNEINEGLQNSTGDNIFNLNNDQNQEVFWEIGDFVFPSYIDNTFKDQYGGIQWTGYFSPILRDPTPRIYFSTTGLLIFEFDPTETNNWQVLKSFYAANRTLTVSSGQNTDVIGLQPGGGKFVGVNDWVGTDTNRVVSVAGDSVQLTSPHNEPTITFSKKLGVDLTDGYVDLPPVEFGKQLKIRISYWYPNNGLDVPDKRIYFDYSSENLPFYSLYDEKPSEVLGPYEIRKFMQEVVTPYQSDFGESNNNKSMFVNSLMFTKYSPKSSFSQIKKIGPVTISCTSTNNLISSTSNLSGVEIGSVVVPAGNITASAITGIIQVKDSLGDNIKVLNSNIGNTTTQSVNFIDYRGLIGWYYSTSTGTTVTLSAGTTDELRTGYIVITPTTTDTDYRYITSIGNNTFETDAELNLAGEQVIYVYSDKGIIDTSKDVFCQGVFGQVLSATAPLGATSLTLSSASGVAVDQVVQYAGSIPPGTTVTGINGNVIDLSSALIAEIKQSATIVFAPSGTGAVNKEGCVIPLDTSPPFIGVPTGLSSGGKGIRAVPANPSLSVVANSFAAYVTTSTDIVSFTTSTYDNRVLIKSGGVNYTILSTRN